MASNQTSRTCTICLHVCARLVSRALAVSDDARACAGDDGEGRLAMANGMHAAYVSRHHSPQITPAQGGMAAAAPRVRLNACSRRTTGIQSSSSTRVLNTLASIFFDHLTKKLFIKC
jgi:hypothetical protein